MLMRYRSMQLKIQKNILSVGYNIFLVRRNKTAA